MACKIWGWENLSIVLYSIYTHTLQVYLQLCKLNALCTVNDWLDLKLLTNIARAVMWHHNVSVLNKDPFRFILNWTVAVCQLEIYFNTCVNLNFRAIHQHIPYIHIYMQMHEVCYTLVWYGAIVIFLKLQTRPTWPTLFVFKFGL